MVILNGLFQQKLSRDIAWTVGSFAILAMSGILINLFVVGFRDAEALGVFNLTYAIYIVMSQFAVVGIQFSVLRYTAYYEREEAERSILLISAAVLVLVLGSIAAIAVYLHADQFGRLFESELAGDCIRFAALGLVLFPLNKILVAYLNGMREMRAFAILQASRYILVMIWVAGVAFSDLPFAYSGLCFVVAETTTTTAAAIYIWSRRLAHQGRLQWTWILRHLSFGSKSFLSGMFVEMNSRIDVLLLGFFLEEWLVGIYSFAAMLVDGVYHLLVMVRVNFNPILVSTVRDQNWTQGQSLLRTCKKFGFGGTLLVSCLVIAGFYILTEFFLLDRGLDEGLASLTILLLGLTVIAPFIPFENLLMVAGHPAFQTLQHLFVVFANVIVNILLVPVIGVEGAALGAVAGYLVGIGVLLTLSPRLVGWNLVTNRIV